MRNLFAYRKSLKYIKRHAFEVDSVEELCRFYHWSKAAPASDDVSAPYRFREDLNQRRVRDSESIATVVSGCEPQCILEIGTAEGGTTKYLSDIAPSSQIHTINIPPEEIQDGAGGKKTTKAYSVEEIGSIYKKAGKQNVRQILCNSADWEPDIENVDVAFIDGCHDAEFVYSDTKKILPIMRPGGFILWHDFNPSLAEKHSWIADVCMGLDRLYREKYLKRELLFVKHSWVGVYQVPL